jgi:hypothetical protein
MADQIEKNDELKELGAEQINEVSGAGSTGTSGGVSPDTSRAIPIMS